MMSLPTGMYRPGYSAIHGLDGAVKLVCFILLAVGTAAAKSAPGAVAAVIVTASIIYLAQLPAATALEPLARLWGLLALIIIVNACFSAPENAVVQYRIFAPSLGALISGAGLALRAALIVVLGNVLVATTSPMTLADALRRLISPLGRLGVPTGEISLTFACAIGLIPTLYAEADGVRRAQTARGARFESRSYFEKPRTVLPLAVPVLVAAFRRAETLADTMEARGADCGMMGERSERASLTGADGAALIVSAAVFALELIIL